MTRLGNAGALKSLHNYYESNRHLKKIVINGARQAYVNQPVQHSTVIAN